MNTLSPDHVPWLEVEGVVYKGADISAHVVPSTSVIVLADGPSKTTRFDEALAREPLAHVMGVNRGSFDMGVEVQVWCTLHCNGNAMGRYGALAPHQFSEDAVAIGWRQSGQSERIDIDYLGDPLCGTSTLPSVLMALWLGYERVLVVGCDMSRKTGYGSPSKWGAWKCWAPYFGGRVQMLGGEIEPIIKEANNG